MESQQSFRRRSPLGRERDASSTISSPTPTTSPSSFHPFSPAVVVPVCPHHLSEVRRLVVQCFLCAACVVGSIMLGSDVFSLGGTVLFWGAPSIIAIFLALNERWMIQWLAISGLVPYLVMILIGHGKVKNCLFLNMVFLVSDAAEVWVVTACLRAVLHKATPSIIRTGAAINAILLFPLVLAPIKAGLNTLLIFMCFGPLRLPLSETLLIWLIGDFFTDFFLLYGVLVVRYYLSLYQEALAKSRKDMEQASTAESSTVRVKKEKEGKGTYAGGGATSTDPSDDMEHAEEGRGVLLVKRSSSKKMQAASTNSSSASNTTESEGVTSSPLHGTPRERRTAHPFFAWVRSHRAWLNMGLFVCILLAVVLASFAAILNPMRLNRQPLFYLGSRLLFPLIGYLTVRYDQLGACIAVSFAAASMLITDFLFNKEKNLYGSIYISGFGTLFQALVCPMLIVIVTWSISYLAVALAERQDTLSLLREKNAQLLTQEKELREAKLAAEQALSSKTEFFARVSHEFRTPLNVVLGFSEELIKQTPGRGVALTSETADRIQYILSAGESLLRVVDDILELFRLSSLHTPDGVQLLQVNMATVEIPPFFRTVCDLVEVISKEHGQLFLKHLDPSLPRCLVIDRDRLSQLMMNLASNACKYSRPVGGVVSIRLSNEGPVEDRPSFITLRLDVQDNGPGIPPDLKDRIFESFFRGGPSVEEAEAQTEEAALAAATGMPYSFPWPRVPTAVDELSSPTQGSRPAGFVPSSSPRVSSPTILSPALSSRSLGSATAASSSSSPWHHQPQQSPPHVGTASPFVHHHHHNHKSKGHGLGLAITKQLVDLLHGRIELQSTVGLGSLFSIFLPVEVAEEGCCPCEDGGVGGKETSGSKEPPPIRGLKILSVEDIVVNQIVLGGMLQQDGHSVAFVETGTAALAAIDATFDLILLDLQLPDMHGIDVLKTLRAHSNQTLAMMPIVVVSALVLDKEKQECASAGADGFITKPVKLQLLRKEIRMLWDSGRLRKSQVLIEEREEKEEGKGERKGGREHEQ